MKRCKTIRLGRLLMALALTLFAVNIAAADKALLDILLGNGAITQAQYDELTKDEAWFCPPGRPVSRKRLDE